MSLSILRCHFLMFFVAAVLLMPNMSRSAPLGGPAEESFDDKYPVMVPVSSTVIPLQLFGKPRPLQGSASQKPRSNSASTYISRRMRLLERSRRPDEPVRLITKNSRQKDVNNNNETH